MLLTRTPPCQCSVCGKKLDVVADASGGEAVPRPGSVSVCFNCGALHLFNEDLTIAPTTIEALGLADESRDRLLLIQKEIRDRRAIRPADPQAN